MTWKEFLCRLAERLGLKPPGYCKKTRDFPDVVSVEVRRAIYVQHWAPPQAPEGVSVMATTKVSFTTIPVSVPAGSDLNFYAVRIDNGAPVIVPQGTTFVDFVDVPPGDHAAFVSASNADGSHQEGERSASFTVPQPTELRPFPDVVTVNLIP